MKKIFTLVAMATMALAANAQSGVYTELGYASIEGFGSDAVTAAANTALGSDGAGNAFTTAFEDQVKSVGVTCNGYNTIVVNGAENSISGGYQGANNPKDEDATGVGASLKVPTQGSVLQIVANADGYMYVVGKFSNNKQYCVFEEGSAIGYEIVIDGTAAAQDTTGVSTVGKAIKATVVGDDADKYFVTTAPMAFLGTLNGVGKDSKTNGAGFIKFAVGKGLTYLVCASGSKLTQCGTIFSETGSESIILKGVNADTQEALADIVLEEATSGINEIAAEAASAKVAKKVINGQVVIVKGDKKYTVAGAEL